MIKILVIDDNQAILNFLKVILLQQEKYEVQTLKESKNAFNILKTQRFDFLILDMDMPKVTGLDILKFINEEKIEIITIVLTGVEDIDLAISAMKLGTFDYMLKPVDEKKLLTTLNTITKEIKLSKSDIETSKKISLKHLKHKEAFSKIITKDENMLKMFFIIEKYAMVNNSVLIWGESGTGKELVAHAIHDISERRNKKFVAINAGAFANDLFASEFFGHSKGAFTGAIKDKKGFIEEANGGTLFLDEIGELSLPIQIKLLRFLQDEEFYHLGSTKNLKANVRIIAATNKNLFEEIKLGNFRKDLFFRLNINSILLPPLRERPDDIILLANHYLNLFNKRYKKNVTNISSSVKAYLVSYPFPGNIRELINIINSGIIVESTNELRKKSLPHYLLENNNITDELAERSKPKSLMEVEKEQIKRVLKFTLNNKSKAAEILGISRVNLIAKVKKYKIE
ncbi:MAG: sigma-54-dependent Fis family transcriptional regulator [Bacteroidales bacterium]|nr:sigma-54-dependent Fis family transcriptional regulator [Bacteroidales bacterium]